MSKIELQPNHPRTLLRPYHRPGIFITGVGTDVGKTTVTAALAAALHRLGVRVGICKPVASGCPLRKGHQPASPSHDQDYLSPDAQRAARAAGLDPRDETILDYIAPVRFAAAVSPHVAARLEQREVDWHRVAKVLDYWEDNCDVLLIEGSGGWLVPLDSHDFTVADLAAALHLPVLVVTGVQLGCLNAAALTVQAIRQRNLAVAGLVINRVPPLEDRDLAIETNLSELPRFCGVPVRAVLPEIPTPLADQDETVPNELVDLMYDFATEWWRVARPDNQPDT